MITNQVLFQQELLGCQGHSASTRESTENGDKTQEIHQMEYMAVINDAISRSMLDFYVGEEKALL